MIQITDDTKFCPRCRNVLIDEGGSYYCMACHLRFVDKNGEMKTTTSILKKRLKTAETAYDELIVIVKHKGNKKKIVEWVKTAGYDIEESDLKGAKLRLPNRDTLFKEWGIRIYPITIYITRDKWRPNKFKRIHSSRTRGFSIYVKDPKLGNIPLNFLQVPKEGIKKHDLHEDLHGAFRIYRGNVRTVSDFILTEIFAFRANIRSGVPVLVDGKWIAVNWNKISDLLVNHYIPTYEENIKEQGESKYRNFLSLKDYYIKSIKNACNKMKFLELQYSEREITHILLRCRDLDDLINWGVKVKGKGMRFEAELKMPEVYKLSEKEVLEKLDKGIEKAKEERGDEDKEVVDKLKKGIEKAKESTDEEKETLKKLKKKLEEDR